MNKVLKEQVYIEDTNKIPFLSEGTRNQFIKQKIDFMTQDSDRELSMNDDLNDQTFYFGHGIIRYASHQYTKQLSNENENLIFAVKNHECQQVGNTLKKLIEISIDGEQLCIQDELVILPNLMKDHEEKMEGEKLANHYQKNLVKNIIKLFLKWLEDESKDSLLCRKVKKRVKSKIKAKNYYNNKLLSVLGKDSQTSAMFARFTQAATPMINSSRIQNKQIHIQSLPFLLRNYFAYTSI